MVFLWYSIGFFWISTGLDKGKFGSATERMYWRFERVSLFRYMIVLYRYTWRFHRDIKSCGKFRYSEYPEYPIFRPFFHLNCSISLKNRFFGLFQCKPPQFFQITLDHWSTLTGCTDVSNRVIRVNYPITLDHWSTLTGCTDVSNFQNSFKFFQIWVYLGIKEGRGSLEDHLTFWCPILMFWCPDSQPDGHTRV